MPIALVIQILLVILLLAGIFATLRLWSVLGSARVTLTNLETTRQEATETLKRLDATVATADQLLREEVAPTLQVARATLANVEVTTRALAETTTSLRRITGRAEAATDAKRLFTAGSALALAAARRKQGEPTKRSGGGLLGALGAGLVGLLTRHKKQASGGKAQALAPAASRSEAPALPAGRNTDAQATKQLARTAKASARNGEELTR
jgi:hypothetical protein